MLIVAIGANLPGQHGASPLAMCRMALERLRGLPGLRLLAHSSWYLTAPIPTSAQPDYVNGVASLEGAIDPADLLARLQDIERSGGRARGVANAARSLDLDIIDMDGLLRDAPDPVLPHPRAHLRAFVLAPLAAIAPAWRHPRLGLTAATLLAGLGDQRVERVPGSG